MSAEGIVSIIKELGPIILAVIALVPIWFKLHEVNAATAAVNVKTEQVVAATQLAREKLDDNTVTTERIESKVDGQATARVEEIKSLQREMSLLRDFIAAQKEVAATLAATAAQHPPVISTEPQSLPEVAKNGGEDSLKQIEQNTGDTARNTARTDAVVNELKDKS